MRALIIIGFLAGLGSVAALAYTTPFLEQERVSSETRVATNGGRLEKFEIRLADDLLTSTPGIDSTTDLYPASVDWYPEQAPFTGDVQVYRLRDVNAVVVGTAIRRREAGEVEWVLHLPARGTMVLHGVGVDIAETGEMRFGLREFADLSGLWEARLDEDGVWRFDTVVSREAESEESA